jgi:hypothetical protein
MRLGVGFQEIERSLTLVSGEVFAGVAPKQDTDPTIKRRVFISYAPTQPGWRSLFQKDLAAKFDTWPDMRGLSQGEG